MLTIKDARILAEQIKEKSPKVNSVELFGSVLRNGQGHDVDFILVVDDELSRQFWLDMPNFRVTGGRRWLMFRRVIKKLLPWLMEAFDHKSKQARQLRASRLVGINLAELSKQYKPDASIDVLLMPHHWQSQIHKITSDRNIAMFFQRIADSSVKLL